jgi:hypothetical protein
LNFAFVKIVIVVRFGTSVKMTTIPTIANASMRVLPWLHNCRADPRGRKELADIKANIQEVVSKHAYDTVLPTEEEIRLGERTVESFPEEDLTKIRITHNGESIALLRMCSPSFYYGVNLLLEEHFMYRRRCERVSEESTERFQRALDAEVKVTDLQEKLKALEERAEAAETAHTKALVEITMQCNATCKNSFAAQKERDESALAEIRNLVMQKEALERRLTIIESRCLDAESQLGDADGRLMAEKHGRGQDWLKHQEELGALKGKHQEELAGTVPLYQLTDKEEELTDLQEDYKGQVDMYWHAQRENISLKNIFHELGKKCMDAAGGVGDDE